MNGNTAIDPEPQAPADGFYLAPFDECYARLVTQWVRTPQQLKWLAPGTEPPLTPTKVARWKKPGGHALLWIRAGRHQPIGYGELNPMRRDPDHLWIGHVVLAHHERGQGFGKAFVRALVTHAFERLGAKRISLIVFPENASAVRCYLRVGFVEVGEERHQFNGVGGRQRLLRLEMTAP